MSNTASKTWIENPVSGERFRFAADAAGPGRLTIEWEARPGAFIPEHFHPRQEERFEIHAGVLRFRLEGRELVARRGDLVIVPPGARHRFANPGPEPAAATLTLSPPLRTRALFEALARAAREGALDRRGRPRRPLRMAVLLREFRDEVRPAFPPPVLQPLLLAPLAAIGRALGVRTG
jgi:quercetin dioxygenase-like cupin family protein